MNSTNQKLNHQILFGLNTYSKFMKHVHIRGTLSYNLTTIDFCLTNDKLEQDQTLFYVLFRKHFLYTLIDLSQITMKEKPRKSPRVPPNSATREASG